VWTEFLRSARAAGLAVLTGFDLFFYQGLDAFEAFTGRVTDPQAVRSVVAGWVPEVE
jgi:shikimate dehydrogenase